jgi:hypothetical protein
LPLRLDAKLSAGDSDHEVTLAWQCYQKLRNIYHARPQKGRELVAEVISSFPSCPIPEVARLGRTLRAWKAAILACFDINGVIETTRRIARGFRNFTNYRLRCLLAAGGHRPYRTKQTNRPTMLKCEGPLFGPILRDAEAKRAVEWTGAVARDSRAVRGAIRRQDS